MTAGVSGREPQDPVAQSGGGAQHRVAGDEHAGAGERAGVESVAVGVGLHQPHPRGRGAEHRGGDLHVGGGCPLTEFGRPDSDFVDAVGTERGPRFGDVLSRRRGFVQ